MTPQEAKKLVDRALATNPGRRLDGSDEPPVAPLTGQVATEGVLGAGHIDAIASIMAKDSHAGDNILARLDPDGREPDDRDPVDPLRTLRFQKKRDGGLGITIEVDALLADQTHAALDPLAERRTDDEGEPDTRSMAERYGDAFGEIIELVITSPDLPVQAGERAHIVVTIPFDVLKTGYGQACLDFTEQLSATDARILACDCGIIPAVLGTQGEPLDLGRMKRIVTTGQRRALRIRDRGCAFPGCRRKPKHCQAHHILEWVLNGVTDLENLCLLCAHHHRLIHRSDWLVRMGDDGLPEFIPPDYLDPLQTPRRNTLHPPLAYAS